MRLILQLIFILIYSANIALAQSSSDSSTSKSFPPKSNSLPDKNSYDIYRTEDGTVIDVKGRERSEAANKKLMKSMGYKHYPMREGEKDWVEEYFTMPPNDMLLGCTYVPGFSFPANCTDKKGNIIFNSSKHKQEVLDKIINSQGKQKGKYNKMPNGGPVTAKDLGVD